MSLLRVLYNNFYIKAIRLSHLTNSTNDLRLLDVFYQNIFWSGFESLFKSIATKIYSFVNLSKILSTFSYILATANELLRDPLRSTKRNYSTWQTARLIIFYRVSGLQKCNQLCCLNICWMPLSFVCCGLLIKKIYLHCPRCEISIITDHTRQRQLRQQRIGGRYGSQTFRFMALFLGFWSFGSLRNDCVRAHLWLVVGVK